MVIWCQRIREWKITNVLPLRLQHHPHVQTRMQMLQHPKFTLTSDIVKLLFKTKSSDVYQEPSYDPSTFAETLKDGS